MSITEVILIVSLVINLFSIIILFITFLNAINTKNQVQQMYVGLSTILTKTFVIEQSLAKIGNGFTEFIRMTENIVDQMNDVNNKVVYKTADGKYTARSVDELIEKIKKDSNSEEYFSDEELDKLKKMFDPEDDFDDEED